MAPTAALPDRSFNDLRRSLVRRRIAGLDVRLRVELALIAILICAFLFWQARVRFDSLARAQGSRGVALALLAAWVVLAIAGGALAGARHAVQLRRAPPGPPWLSLPVAPSRLARHLAWEARLHALWMAFAAPPLLVAAAGRVPAWWLALLAAAFVWMLLEASRAGTALARRLALLSAEPRPGLEPIERLLSAAPRRPSPAGGGGRARWTRVKPWRALWAKDWLLTRRPTAARRRAIAPAAFAILAIASWGLLTPALSAPLAAQIGQPVTTALAHALAFALSLLAAATLGEWLISLSGEDPFPVLRGLPVGAATVWKARMAWVVVLCVLLAAGHALAARALSPQALQVFLVWSGGGTMMIGLLAVNYGITLFPNEHAAQRIFALSLAIAIAASLMIPLMGWIVLLAGALHSARRLTRWPRLEDST